MPESAGCQAGPAGIGLAAIVARQPYRAVPAAAPEAEFKRKLMKIAFSKAALPTGAVIIVPSFEDGEPTAAHDALDAATSGALGKAIKSANFTGKKGQILDLVGPHGLEAAARDGRRREAG